MGNTHLAPPASPFLSQRLQTTPVTSPGPVSWTGTLPFPLFLGGLSTFSSSRLPAESDDCKNSCYCGALHLAEVLLYSKPLFLLTCVLPLRSYPGLHCQARLLPCMLLLLPLGLISGYPGLLLGLQMSLFCFLFLSFGLCDLRVKEVPHFLEVLGGGHGGGCGEKSRNFSESLHLFHARYLFH